MSLHKKTKRKDSKKRTASLDEDVEERRGCRSFLMRLVFKFGLIILALAILIPAGIYIAQPKYYMILLIGSDQRNTERARSDALLLVAIPKSKKNAMSMVMVPRDTKIDHPEKGLQKITHFYAMWEDENEYLGNKVLVEEVVEDLLDIKIHGTAEVTFDSFIEIVDMLGGVDTESAGHLDGKEAKEVVHNRMNKVGGDFGRGKAQREIIINMMSRLKSPTNAQAVYDYFKETDRARLDIDQSSLTTFGFAYVLGHLGDFSLGEINEQVLPGVGQRIYTESAGKELYYWILDEEGTKEVVDEYLR